MGQDMLSKVRALLDKAESTTFPAEAETLRAKAEELMRKYRIEEENLLAQDPTSLEPIFETFEMCDYASPFRQQYVDLFWIVARHAGIRTRFVYSQGRTMAEAVGYETDMRYAELIFTSARMAFADRLEPSVDAKLSDQVNAYRLRSAGMERVRASLLLWGKKDPAKVGRLYLAECKARGETPALAGRGVTGKVYRESYAEEFVWTLDTRLRKASDAADSVGGTLTLHGRKERVDEAFYARFPHYRPSTEVEAVQSQPCEKCTSEKQCRDHRETAKDRQARQSRINRYYSQAATKGREAGTTAARHVDLHRGTANRAGESSTQKNARGLTGLDMS